MGCAAVRVLGGGLAVLVSVLAGCGMGSNKGEVCEDSKKAVQQYVVQLRSTSADDAKQWKAATERLALQLDTLAKKADDAKVRKALQDQSAQLRVAATGVGTGDAAPLDKTLTDTPGRLGQACE